MLEGDCNPVIDENRALREQLSAERDRADRFQIEANIMRELASRIREIAVSFGYQVVSKCKAYAEEVAPLMESSEALEEEIERRLVEKREREQKRELATKCFTGIPSLHTGDVSEVQGETVQGDTSVVSGVSCGEHEEVPSPREEKSTDT